jgi:Peptidase A4 family
MTLRHIGWLCGFIVVLLMSWVLCASLPTVASLPSARPLTGAPRDALLTPPLAAVAPGVVHPPRIRVGPDTSTNWSGYVVTGPAGSVSDVTGSWVVPAVTCATSKTAASSFWIGIDGDASPTVEQIGTDSDCQHGVPTYFAWFEFFPFAARRVGTVPVAPGDVITAAVTYEASSHTFTLALTNVTQQAAFTVSRPFPARRASAEWIAEAPSSGGGVLPLADFGTVEYGVDFTGVSATNTATINGITAPIGSFGTAVQAITMVSQSKAIKAQPSGLSPDGTSFSVTWVSAGP